MQGQAAAVWDVGLPRADRGAKGGSDLPPTGRTFSLALAERA